MTRTPHISAEKTPISPQLLNQLAYNQNMAELGRMSAGMIHELNAPLSVIVSAAQMIMREQDVSDFVREMVGRIGSEAQRLSQMTRGILNFSSQPDGAGEADVNLTAGFMLDFIGYEAARRRVTLLRSLDHRLPAAGIDPNILKRILLNLVMNALQAMEEEGGRLLVETRSGGEGRICILVIDNGPGIPPESLEKVFEPYFSTKAADTGTGLGLFVARNLLQSIGGDITASHTPGGGATFTVTLPALPEQPESPPDRNRH